jgi:hypothetical protein
MILGRGGKEREDSLTEYRNFILGLEESGSSLTDYRILILGERKEGSSLNEYKPGTAPSLNT